MTLLEDAVEAKKFDTRIAERNIDRGLIKGADYQKFVQSLPDETGNAEWTDLEDLAKQDPVPKKLPKNDFSAKAPGESESPSDVNAPGAGAPVESDTY